MRTDRCVQKPDSTIKMEAEGAGYLGNSGATVTPNGFDPLGVKHRLLLVQALVHVAHVPLLGLQHARQVHLKNEGFRITPSRNQKHKNVEASS